MPDPRALCPKLTGHLKRDAGTCMPYTQNYDPCHHILLSVLLASLPVVTLFVMLVPLRLLAPWAAAGGAFMALVIAVLVYGMPAHMAGLSFLNGALFGLLPICWVISWAMLLYNITVETGRFEGIKRSVAGLSADHRLQAVLIAFCFGAFLEGAAGGGTPVAIRSEERRVGKEGRCRGAGGTDNKKKSR